MLAANSYNWTLPASLQIVVISFCLQFPTTTTATISSLKLQLLLLQLLLQLLLLLILNRSGVLEIVFPRLSTLNAIISKYQAMLPLLLLSLSLSLLLLLNYPFKQLAYFSYSVFTVRGWSSADIGSTNKLLLLLMLENPEKNGIKKEGKTSLTTTT